MSKREKNRIQIWAIYYFCVIDKTGTPLKKKSRKSISRISKQYSSIQTKDTFGDHNHQTFNFNIPCQCGTSIHSHDKLIHQYVQLLKIGNNIINLNKFFQNNALANQPYSHESVAAQ